MVTAWNLQHLGHAGSKIDLLCGNPQTSCKLWRYRGVYADRDQRIATADSL